MTLSIVNGDINNSAEAEEKHQRFEMNILGSAGF